MIEVLQGKARIVDDTSTTAYHEHTGIGGDGAVYKQAVLGGRVAG
jgi:hypothetical protein